MLKQSQLVKRKTKIRKKISKQKKYRLTVYKTNKHIYAQLYTHDGNKIITSMSTLDKLFKEELIKNKTIINKTNKANLVGSLLADKIKNKNITNVVFDRSGFMFHGRIKAVAEAIKAHGIKC